MAYQFSTRFRNAALDTLEPLLGATAIMEIRTGAPPANCAAADTGTLLAVVALPADAFAAAASGSKALQGTWQDTEANASGTAGHFRIKATDGTVEIQGTVSRRASAGGTGDVQLAQDTEAIVAGQVVTATAFSVTAGGA